MTINISLFKSAESGNNQRVFCKRIFIHIALMTTQHIAIQISRVGNNQRIFCKRIFIHIALMTTQHIIFKSAESETISVFPQANLHSYRPDDYSTYRYSNPAESGTISVSSAKGIFIHIALMTTQHIAIQILRQQSAYLLQANLHSYRADDYSTYRYSNQQNRKQSACLLQAIFIHIALMMTQHISIQINRIDKNRSILF